MIDLSAEYERHINVLAMQKMDALEYVDIIEALNNSVEIDDLENDLVMAVRHYAPTLVVNDVCYQYWRGIAAYKLPFSAWVETYKEDHAADKAERNHDTYEMNNGSDK